MLDEENEENGINGINMRFGSKVYLEQALVCPELI